MKQERLWVCVLCVCIMYIIMCCVCIVYVLCVCTVHAITLIILPIFWAVILCSLNQLYSNSLSTQSSVQSTIQCSPDVHNTIDRCRSNRLLYCFTLFEESANTKTTIKMRRATPIYLCSPSPGVQCPAPPEGPRVPICNRAIGTEDQRRCESRAWPYCY